MPDDRDATQQALDPLDYLTSSEHRVRVLESLTETIPPPGRDTPGLEPRELRAITGASDATVNRILNEFEERGWAKRDLEGGYTATPLGRSIAHGFAPLLDSVKAIQHLGEAVALLPLDELSIGLEHFRDATVREPQGSGPRDWFRFLSELIAESATQYMLYYLLPPERLVDEFYAQITAGNIDDHYMIMSESVMEYRREHNPEQVLAELEAGSEMYRYDGHISCNIYIFDETVVFENSQVPELRDSTAIVSRDDVVREWVHKVLERYREASHEIVPDDIPE